VHLIVKYKLDHLVFWLVTVAFYALNRANLITSAGPFVYLADVIVHNIVLIVACYLNIYVLFPKFFRKDRYLNYITAVILLLVAYTLIQNAIDTWISRHHHEAGYRRSFFFNTYYNASIGIFYLAFTLSLELSKRWYKQQLQMHQMQAEKFKTELEYLKAQMNPHFLFNSINTIYFQIDKLNVQARNSLEKFSELLRYQLYECNEDNISIEKEVSYLESYVDLQRLRNSAMRSIVFNRGKSVKDFNIAPLLLLPFVENAFKHVSSGSEENNEVEITMSRQNGWFNFCVANTVDGTEAKKEPGIGLKNVGRRLDLLYGARYKLDIHKSDNRFMIELHIPLA
jgi:two-component system, LytTR family, sensor kinase